MALRVEELESHLNNLTVPLLNYLDQDTFDNKQSVRDMLLIQAVLALGNEVNMLRVALNTNSIDLEECVNRIVDESIRVVMIGTK